MWIDVDANVLLFMVGLWEFDIAIVFFFLARFVRLFFLFEECLHGINDIHSFVHDPQKTKICRINRLMHHFFSRSATAIACSVLSLHRLFSCRQIDYCVFFLFTFNQLENALEANFYLVPNTELCQTVAASWLIVCRPQTLQIQHSKWFKRVIKFDDKIL